MGKSVIVFMKLLAAVNFCSKTKSVWVLVGKLLSVFKIVIPLLIIIFGMIDLGKAVVASKDDEIKKAAKSLGFRALAGILIFFNDICCFIFRCIVMNAHFICKGALLHNE